MARRYSSLFPPPIFSIWHSGLQPRRRLRASATRSPPLPSPADSCWPSPIPRLIWPSLPYSPGPASSSEDGVLDATVKIVLLGVMIVVIHMCWLLAGASLSRVLQDPTGRPHRQCLAGGGPDCHDRNRSAGLTRSGGCLPFTGTRSTATGTRRQSPAPPPGPPDTATSATARRPATPARSRTRRRTPRRTAARTARCPSPG